MGGAEPESGGTSTGAGGTSTGAGGTSIAAGGTSIAAGGTTASTTPALPTEGCYASQARGEQSTPSYVRYEYAESTRILSEHFVTVPEPGAVPTNSLHYRVDAAGRLLTYAGDSGGAHGNFRHDYVLDNAGNATSFVFVYEDWTDLTQPATAAPYMYDNYAHTYDGNGLLQQSARVASSYTTTAVTSFTHDAEGRCQTGQTSYASTPASSTLVTYNYADGRLAQIATEATILDQPNARRMVADYRYDSAGRLISVEQDGGGHWGATADGIPDIVEYWTYSGDGTWTDDYRDYTTDTPNETIVVAGTERSCYRVVVTFSTGCNQFKALLPKPTAGLECRYTLGRSLPL